MIRAHAQTDTIFLEALAVPAGPERGNFLAKACGEDAALRGRLDTMLADDTAADVFFDGSETLMTLPGLSGSRGSHRYAVGDRAARPGKL